jgi:diguanylate cyclase (GGDEF)-like protein
MLGGMKRALQLMVCPVIVLISSWVSPWAGADALARAPTAAIIPSAQAAIATSAGIASVAGSRDSASAARDQAKAESIGTPFVQFFGPEQHGWDAHVISLAQAHNGDLLIGDADGLLSYSGGQFTQQDLVRDFSITSMASSDGKTVFGGTSNDFGKLSVDTNGAWVWHSLKPVGSPDDGQIWSVVCNLSATYFVSNHTINIWREGQPLKIVKTELWLTAAYQLQGKVVFSAFGRGLYELDANHALSPVPAFAELAQSKIRTIVERKNDALIFASNPERLYLLDAQGLHLLAQPALTPMLESRPYVAKAAGNSVIVGGLSGQVWWLRDNLSISMQRDLAAGAVLDLLIDPERTVWIASERGLHQMQWPSPWTSYGPAQGLSGTTNDVQRYQGKLWLAASNGVYALGPDGFAPRGIPEEQAFSLTVTSKGMLALYGSGVFDLDAGKMVPELNAQIINQLQVDPQNSSRVFALRDDGVAQFELRAGTWHMLWNQVLEHSTDAITEIPTAPGGPRQLLLHSDQPVILSLSADGAISKKVNVSGLPPSKLHYYFALGADVFATTETSRWRLHGAQFLPDTLLAAVPLSERVHSGYVSSHGHQWLAGSTGIYFRAQAKDAFELVPQPKAGVRLNCMEPDGASMLFCDSLALMRLSPVGVDSGGLKYHIELKSVLRNQKISALSDAYQLHTGETLGLEFHVNTHQARVQYRGRIHLADQAPEHLPEWGVANHQPRWTLSELSPGKYIFEAQASVIANQWTPAKRIEITVPGRWWQSPGGRTLSVALGVIAAAALLTFFLAKRNSSLGQRAQTLEKMVAERTESLFEKTNELQQLNCTLTDLAMKDGLTLVANRRHFDTRLEAALQESDSSETAVALCLLDLDHFKKYNDHFGHIAGDELLRRCASALASEQQTYWPAGLLARYGGEEFAVILERCDLAQAREMAERLRWRVQEAFSELGVTVSVGVAAGFALHAKALIEKADAALYRAKAQGRNCVISD